MRSIKTIVRSVLNEEIRRQLNEGFNSNKMREFFKQHGGVKRVYTKGDFMKTPDEMRAEMGDRMSDDEYNKYSDDYNNTKDDHYAFANQDALGDITDDDIVYMKVFELPHGAKQVEHGRRTVENQALSHAWELNHPVGRNGSRHPFNSETYYTVYKANDGTCLVVGLSEKTVPTYPTWGGHYSAKKANRYWNNNEKMRYEDDSDTYYYGKKAKSFGIRTNKDFKNRKDFNNDLRSKMSPEEFQDYIDNEVQGQREYIKNNFPPYNF